MLCREGVGETHLLGGVGGSLVLAGRRGRGRGRRGERRRRAQQQRQARRAAPPSCGERRAQLAVDRALH